MDYPCIDAFDLALDTMDCIVQENILAYPFSFYPTSDTLTSSCSRRQSLLQALTPWRRQTVWASKFWNCFLYTVHSIFGSVANAYNLCYIGQLFLYVCPAAAAVTVLVSSGWMMRTCSRIWTRFYRIEFWRDIYFLQNNI